MRHRRKAKLQLAPIPSSPPVRNGNIIPAAREVLSSPAFACLTFLNDHKGHTMGLLSFIKDVGEKLFGANEAQAASVDEMKKELDKHGLNAEALDIKVDGDTVTVSGQAASTEEAEKIAMA